MFNFLPHRLPDVDRFTHWCNQLLDWCTKNEIQSSSDILVNKGSNGTTLTLVRQPNAAPSQPAAPAQPLNFAVYNNSMACNSGTLYRVITPIGTTTPVGTYYCCQSTPPYATGNMVPQYPEPVTSNPYWYFLCFGVQQVGVCAGGSGNVYVNASNPF